MIVGGETSRDMFNLKSVVQAVSNRRNKARFRRLYTAETAVDLSAISEFRSEAFPGTGPDCWLDRPDADREIDRKLNAGVLTESQAEALHSWVRDGFLIASGLLDEASLDATWAAYEAALARGALSPRAFADAAQTLDERQLDPHLIVPEIRALQNRPEILRWTDLLFGRRTIPFQTIMGHAGSQQAAHSDSIHMTTYPLGYLVACWVAFEDIRPDSGPLVYYPGSHRLPYLLSADVGLAPKEFKSKGYSIYSEKYEPEIKRICEQAGLREEIFLAKKGDVLFWHANLVHGGSPRANDSVSRKALVCHYFAEGTVTYHDLSGNPTRLHQDGLYRSVRP